MRSIGVALSGLLALGTAHGAGLDTTFGTGGRLLPDAGTGTSTQANGAILQSDGKIVVVGTSPATFDAREEGFAPSGDNDPSRDFLIMRLNSDGSLDKAFGSGGLVQIDFNQKDDRAQAVVQQSDGKLIVVGSATSSSLTGDFDLAAVRLLPDGSVDDTFGVAGKLTVNIPPDPNAVSPIGGFGFINDHPQDIAYSVAVQQDGRVVIGGRSQQCSTGACPILTRLTADGAIDTSFGPSNTGTLVLGAESGSVHALVIEPSGAILATTAMGPVEVDAGGKSATSTVGSYFGSVPLAVYDLALQPDGRIVFAGEKTVDQPDGTPSIRWLVGRAQTAAMADTTFGAGGSVVGSGAFLEGYLPSLLLEPSGKVVAGGFISTGSDLLSRQDAMLLRLQSDGTADVNFGTNGILLTNFSEGQTEYSYRQSALLRLPDGKLLMVGNRSNLTPLTPYYSILTTNSERIAIARFNSTPEYSLASSPISVSNTAGSVSVQITRTGATSAPVNVVYATTDLTAVAGTDYVATSGTLTWLPGDADGKSISIPIKNNGLSSGSRTFTVALSSPSEGSIDNPSAQVTIQDNAPPPASSADPDTGSGGGGCIDWLLLTILGAAALVSRQASRDIQ